MTDFELLTAADIPLMQGLAQRVTAIRPDLISAGASYGELAWVWGQGRARYGATLPRRLWFSGDDWWRGAGPFFRARSGAMTGRSRTSPAPR